MCKSSKYSSWSAGVYLLLSLCFFCGFVSLSDVETAIIEKDFKGAKVLAENFIKENPASSEINQVKYYLGISELGLSNYPEARRIFQQVMEFSATDSLYEKAWLGIIDALGMEQNFEEDRKQAEQFLKKRPDSEFLSIIYLKLGRANLKLAQWSKAQKYLKKVINDFPNSYEAHTARQLLAEKRYFAIQVGSFLSQERAIALVEELRNQGEYAYILETQDHQNRVFYRVRVGQLRSLREANRMQERLSNRGYPTHIYP